LYRAGLAKLCGRKPELKAAEQAARRSLSPQSWRRFQKSMNQVQAGRSQPNPFLPVMACKEAK
jgi:hypothetical protein